MGNLMWTRRYSFQSVHALNSGVLRERKHGHHYELEVSFEGRDIDGVDAVVKQLVLDRLHAREITVIPHSTGEALVNWIHERLAESTLGKSIRAVALQETRKNRFVSARTEAFYV